MSDDAGILARVVAQLSGRCRVCGCAGDICSLPEGEKCCWVDRLRTLCSNPACLMAACKQKRKAKWARRKTKATRRSVA